MGTFTLTTDFTPLWEPEVDPQYPRQRLIYFGKVTGSSSYATGGDTLTVPFPSTHTLESVFISVVGSTRLWTWDGGTTTVKLKAVDAFNTEEGATTNVSGDVLHIMLVYVRP